MTESPKTGVIIGFPLINFPRQLTAHALTHKQRSTPQRSEFTVGIPELRFTRPRKY